MVDERPDRAKGATTAVVRDAETIALLVHRDLLGDARVVEEVASAASVAFDNERLHAAARAQLAELRTSQARLVAASDRERQQLERDLHDGAQQRLVGLTLALRLTRARLGPESELAAPKSQRRVAPKPSPSTTCATSLRASIPPYSPITDWRQPSEHSEKPVLHRCECSPSPPGACHRRPRQRPISSLPKQPGSGATTATITRHSTTHW